MVASLDSCDGCSETIGIKKMVTVSLLCVNVLKYLLSKFCGWAYLAYGSLL
jgi:hypothetical protein